MTQKIFDIIPPEKIEEAIKPPEIREKPLPLEPGFKKRKIFLIVVGVLILIGGGSYFLITPKAEIEIYPKTKLVNFNTEVTIAEVVKAITPSKNLILGEVIEKEKIVSEKFSSSAIVKKEIKAGGTIRVYNNYSVAPQAFISQTRFVSDSGKVFLTSERVVVPGKKIEEGKWVPGFVDIEVRAAQAGPDYNIEPATFSIPGLRGTPLYTFFYAKSFKPMEGGEIFEVHQVTEKDLQEAKDFLAEKALTDTQNALKREAPEGWALLEETIESEIVEISPLAEAGQEIESFTVQVKAKSKGFLFKKSDINQFTKDYVLSNIAPDQNLYLESLAIKYSFKDPDILGLEITAQIYPKIDIDALKRAVIVGGGAVQINRDVLKNFPEIDKVEVKFWPFWIRKAPTDIKNIEVNLNFAD